MYQLSLESLNNRARTGFVVRPWERIEWNQVNLASDAGLFDKPSQLIGMLELVVNAIQHGVFKGHAAIVRQRVR